MASEEAGMPDESNTAAQSDSTRRRNSYEIHTVKVHATAVPCVEVRP